MPRVFYNGSIQSFRGRIGNLIFRQLPDGTTVVSQAPPRKNRGQKKRAKLKRSARQQAHNDRFQEASAYARQSAKTQPIYAELAAAAIMKTAYNFALSDWFRPPEIHCVERREERIRVQASDNIMVTRVRVTVLDQEGSVLEKGEAVRGEGDWWEFTSQTEGKKIIAEAWDLPKNVTRFVLELDE
jgi:hypothetical protein